ncbi:MAG TPA: RraA family protein [Terriglobia bacterium]|nr:RraA family protein [Terriglobia bacterium]
MVPVLTPEELEPLRRLTSCEVADAIEHFDIRLRNEGFMDSSVRCVFPNFPSMVGYAVTAQVRTSEPPMTGRSYPDRTDWWNYLLTIPAPRVVVLEDLDRTPGRGSCAGDVHAHVFRALGCVGLVTNGAVRDLPSVESMGFSFFAGNVVPSRVYFHMLEFGLPVEVGGLTVRPGDLLHGDRHGVIKIPGSIARDLPAAAARVAALESAVIEVADSPNPALDQLREAVLRSVQDLKPRL